ncbi:TPA: hypothetical protein DCP42_03295 [Patescibacteria group bacterium]|nr:hypothetical protein [Patescibacteria group bacterium]
MYWELPKDEHCVYEALSAIADERITLNENRDGAKCISTSKGKFYTISYDSQTKSIMSNDNMAYYNSRISYPMIAFLMLNGEIEYGYWILNDLKGIYWKQINQKFKNDFMKAVDFVLVDLDKQGKDIELIKKEIERIYKQVRNLKLEMLGEKTFPPQAY